MPVVTISMNPFKRAEHDLKYVNAWSTSEDPLISESGKACLVKDLEHRFEFLRTAVGMFIELDNELHRTDAEEGWEKWDVEGKSKLFVTDEDGKRVFNFDKWYVVLRRLFSEFRKALLPIARQAKKLNASEYDDAKLTPQSVSEVKEKLDQALAGIREWETDRATKLK